MYIFDNIEKIDPGILCMWILTYPTVPNPGFCPQILVGVLHRSCRAKKRYPFSSTWKIYLLIIGKHYIWKYIWKFCCDSVWIINKVQKSQGEDVKYSRFYLKKFVYKKVFYQVMFAVSKIFWQISISFKSYFFNENIFNI